MSELADRYRRMAESAWFRAAHVGKSLGDSMKVEGGDVERRSDDMDSAMAERVYPITNRCICHEAYKERGLVQHDCAFCDHGDEVADLFSEIDRLKERVADLVDELDAADREIQEKE